MREVTVLMELAGNSMARCVMIGRVRTSPVAGVVASGRGTACDNTPSRAATSGSKVNKSTKASSVNAAVPSAWRKVLSAAGRVGVATK